MKIGKKVNISVHTLALIAILLMVKDTMSYLKRKTSYSAEPQKSNLLNISETKNNIDIKLNKIDGSVAELLERIAQLEKSLSVLKETLKEKPVPVSEVVVQPRSEVKSDLEDQDNSIFEHAHKKSHHWKQRRYNHENHRSHQGQQRRGNRENSQRNYYRHRPSNTLPLFDFDKDRMETQNAKKEADEYGNYTISFSVETTSKPENLQKEINSSENPTFKSIFHDFNEKEEALKDAIHEVNNKQNFKNTFHDFNEKEVALKNSIHEEKQENTLKDIVNELHDKLSSKDASHETLETARTNENEIFQKEILHDAHNISKFKIIIPEEHEKPTLKSIFPELNEKANQKENLPQAGEKTNQKENLPQAGERLNFKDIFPDVSVDDPVIEVKRFDDIADFKKYKDSIINHKKLESDHAVETSYYRMSDVLGNPNHPTELPKKETLEDKKEIANTVEQKNQNVAVHEEQHVSKESEEKENQPIMIIGNNKKEEATSLQDILANKEKETEKQFKFCESFENPKEAYDAGKCIFKDATLSTRISMFSLSPAEHKMLMNPAELVNNIHDTIKHVENKIKETKEEEEKALNMRKTENVSKDDVEKNKVEAEKEYTSTPRDIEALQLYSKNSSMKSKNKDEMDDIQKPTKVQPVTN